MVSILRLPMSMTYDSYSGPDTGAAAYRGHADGGHVESYGKLRSNDVMLQTLPSQRKTGQNSSSEIHS